MLTEELNWLAVIAGAVIAFVLGMFWFSPMMFGKLWTEGSHGIRPPETLPVAAIVIQALGTFALAVVIGLTATVSATITAVLVVVAATLLVAGMALFSQKSTAATVIDAAYIAAMGAIMILAHAIL